MTTLVALVAIVLAGFLFRAGVLLADRTLNPQNLRALMAAARRYHLEMSIGVAKWL